MSVPTHSSAPALKSHWSLEGAQSQIKAEDAETKVGAEQCTGNRLRGQYLRWNHISAPDDLQDAILEDTDILAGQVAVVVEEAKGTAKNWREAAAESQDEEQTAEEKRIELSFETVVAL